MPGPAGTVVMQAAEPRLRLQVKTVQVRESSDSESCQDDDGQQGEIHGHRKPAAARPGRRATTLAWQSRRLSHSVRPV